MITPKRPAVTLALAALASVSLFAIAQAQTASTTSGPVKPLWGNLRPFSETTTSTQVIDPYWGNLRPFWGNLRPFWGNLRPFWGNLRPFWGNLRPFSGDVTAFWGNLRPFQGPLSGDAIESFWTTAGAQWDDAAITLSQSASTAEYQASADKLSSVLQSAAQTWDSAIVAQGGAGFQASVADPLLGKYGIKLNDPATLAALSPTDRAMFFFELYDTLMGYSGSDRVDHWMRTVNWSPKLTQVQGSGADTVIGLLDFTVAAGAPVSGNIVSFDGVSSFTNGHGAAVASLMVAPHDGKGVMGIAPRARVVAYNPFDASGTANWADVTKGVLSLSQNRASIINMSLGEAGWTLPQGWNDVFTAPAVATATKNSVFVIAAGNEGLSQTTNVAWNAANPNIILVGSVNLEGQISEFSNRPGTACMITAGSCAPGSRLMDRFIVAPGELILVSNDSGGVMRASGTSIAAPIVSGAIALLHDRWPWLANYPRITADIILKSARDLGAPGVDPVYGVGLLDIEAAQSPSNFSQLVWYYSDDKGKLRGEKVAKVIRTAVQENQAKWDSKGIFYYAFEGLGATQRDFAIPLSQKLIGQTVTTASGSQEQFQDYLLARMESWTTGQGFASPAQRAGQATFAGFSAGAPIANPWGAEMGVTFAPRTRAFGFMQEGIGYQSRLHVASEGRSLDLGFGDGANMLGALPGFSQAADYDSEKGGVNPLLGLASGGAFANANFQLAERLQISAGVTQRDLRRERQTLPMVDGLDSAAARYAASAQHLAVNYRLARDTHVVASYTRLSEATGLLGVQSLDAADLPDGSVTRSFSLGLDARLAQDLSLSISGTRAVTHAGGANAIAVAPGGLVSSAYQVSLTRESLFSKGDRTRLTLSQPLFVEKGALQVSGVEVIDRTTGQIGLVMREADVAQARPLAAELLYARPILDERADLSLFARAERNPGAAEPETYLAGARLRIGF